MKTSNILMHKRAYPDDCRKNYDVIYIFGDNVRGWGYAGQACIRNEPNSFGIPTKWKPSRDDSAYFNDRDIEIIKYLLDPIFDALTVMLQCGNKISFPLDGIGTGLSELPTRAPKVYQYICDKMEELKNDF